MCGCVAQSVKLLVAYLYLLSEYLVQILAAWLLTQLPANACWEAVVDGSSAWSPVTHIGDPKWSSEFLASH